MTFPGLAHAAVVDEIVVAGGQNQLGRVALPAGPVLATANLAEVPANLTFLPFGRLLAITGAYGSERLSEIGPDGSIVPIGEIERLGTPGYTESLGALSADLGGRLFLLRYLSGPGDFKTLLSELDPRNATTLKTVPIAEYVDMLAPGSAGLWTKSEDGTLRNLDPDSGKLGPPVADLESFLSVIDADTDSAGRVYLTQTCNVCSPPFYQLSSVDPATGEPREEPELSALLPYPAYGLAIRRRCSESPTARCLQGGRFRAEVSFKDYAGVAGAAQVAAARSADTGIFYFFEPANWELMAKVLDGCGLNGHFWVFAAASTDVEFTLSVTDSETGAVKTYHNPLGQLAHAVADTGAFSCSP